MSENIIGEEEDTPVELDDSLYSGFSQSELPTVLLTEHHNKENTGHTEQTKNKVVKRKKRKSIGQQSMRKKKRLSGGSTLAVEAKEIDNKRRASSQVDAEVDNGTERELSTEPTSTKHVGLSKKEQLAAEEFRYDIFYLLYLHSLTTLGSSQP